MSYSRRLGAVAILGVSALALAACAGSTDDAAEPAATESAAAEAETVSFTWDRNINEAIEDADPEFESTTVEVPKNPEKIVAFEMASLDTIGALGGEVAGAPLESVPDYLQDYIAEDSFNAGTLFEADLIEIEAQQPDLIIIGGRSSPLYDDLSQIAPTIDLGITGTYLETLDRNVTFLGEVLGAEEEAAATLDDLNAGIEEAKAGVVEQGAGLTVMISGGELTALAPSSENASGSASASVRGGLTYDLFGLEPVVDNVLSASHGEPISFEFLLEHNPAVLFVVDRDSATGESSDAAAQVLDNDIVAQTDAAQNDNIHYLQPVPWYIVYGGIDTTQLLIDDIAQAVL